MKSLSDDWKDFEDSVQYYTALSEDSDCFVTINKGDYTKSEIPVFSPVEFVELQPIKELLNMVRK